MPASGGQWTHLSRHHESRWYRSYRPCGGPCMVRHTGLGGAPRRAPCHTKTCEAVARSLKIKVDSAARQGAGMGQSFPMWTRSRDAKSVTSVHSAGEGAKNSPVKAGVNRTPVPLIRLSNLSSTDCGFPAGLTVEFRPYVHRHGTLGRPSADGAASRSCHLRRDTTQ